jgi:hypothetical protein
MLKKTKGVGQREWREIERMMKSKREVKREIEYLGGSRFTGIGGSSFLSDVCAKRHSKTSLYKFKK